MEKKMMQGTMPGARRRGRPRTAWMDNIKTWTRLSVEEPVRITEDRDKWRKYLHEERNRTGGIKRYHDPSVCPSVCLSHGAAALGY